MSDPMEAARKDILAIFEKYNRTLTSGGAGIDELAQYVVAHTEAAVKANNVPLWPDLSEEVIYLRAQLATEGGRPTPCWRLLRLHIAATALLIKERDALLTSAAQEDAYCLAHQHSNRVEEAICSLRFQRDARRE